MKRLVHPGTNGEEIELCPQCWTHVGTGLHCKNTEWAVLESSHLEH